MQQAFEDHSLPAPRIQSVDRAIRLLKAVADSPVPPTLPMLAGAARVNASTAWRLLATLQDHGLVARRRGGYVVGYSAVRIAAAADDHVLASIARPLLERLAEETQEAVSLSVPRHGTIVAIDHVAGPRVVSAGWIGDHLPLHCTSNGKLLLASWPPDELKAFLAEPLTALTPHTITDPDALRDDLALIRRRGYGVEVEEFEIGLHAVSAAVRGLSGDSGSVRAASRRTATLPSRNWSTGSSSLIVTASVL